MMDCLIVWAALGPVLAFIAGAVVVAWWDDDDDEPPLLDLPRWVGEAASGGPRPIPHPSGPVRSAWVPLAASAPRHSGGRATGSCVQCGRGEGRP